MLYSPNICSSYTQTALVQPSQRLTRQSAIDSPQFLSPPTPILKTPSFHDKNTRTRRSHHPLSPTVHITPQTSLDYGPRRPSVCPRSPNLLSPPPSSSPTHTRRPSSLSPEEFALSRETSTRIGANVRSKRQYSVPVQEKLKKSKSKEEEKGMDPLPVMGAVIIASLLGGPVCLVANIKLGLFAAIGGGIMGYTTGKMFSDHG